MSFTERRASSRWRGGYRDPATGRKVTQTFDYQYEAEAWADAAERVAFAAHAARPAAPSDEVEKPEPEPAPVDGPPTVPTLAAHGRELIARRSGRLADATVRSYRTQLAGLTLSGIGARSLADLRRSDVERWITSQIDNGVGRATVNARLKLLRMITLDAKAELLVTHDPGAGVDYLTTDIAADLPLTAAAEAALLLAAPGPLRVAAIIALDAGLRWSEVYGLAVDSIAGEYLVVRQVVERTTRKIRHYPKGHRRRVVPMTERLAAEIAPLVAATRERGGPDALLFPSTTGGPMSYESWRRLRWSRAVAAAGLTPPPGFHTLRHTYGSRLAAASVPRSEIAQLLGHADEATTARYIHAGDDGRRLELVRKALA